MNLVSSAGAVSVTSTPTGAGHLYTVLISARPFPRCVGFAAAAKCFSPLAGPDLTHATHAGRAGSIENVIGRVESPRATDRGGGPASFPPGHPLNRSSADDDNRLRRTRSSAVIPGSLPACGRRQPPFYLKSGAQYRGRALLDEHSTSVGARQGQLQLGASLGRASCLSTRRAASSSDTHGC